jgi:hypothetical protein
MITVLNPSYSQTQTSKAVLPARPREFGGATIGIISNGKVGARSYFDHLERLLREQWGVAEVIRRTKRNYSAPAESALIEQTAKWAVMFAGVGD